MNEHQLWAGFERSAIVNHGGEKGTLREDGVAAFLRDQLPGRYGVVKGELIDSSGRRSNQIDILVFDKNGSAPFLRGEHYSGWVLPAEAVLAVVEVKSVLSSSELDSVGKGVHSLYALRPWKERFHVVTSDRDRLTDVSGPRVYVSVFAYKTDLGAQDWGAKEIRRARERLLQSGARSVELDRIVVLKRGMVNVANGKQILAGERGVLAEWFFSLVNFLEREAPRRARIPFEKYRPDHGSAWKQVVEDDYPGAAERRATAERAHRMAPRLKSVLGAKR